MFKLNDPIDQTIKPIVDIGSNNYLVNQFNEIVSPGNVIANLTNIFTNCIRMIDAKQQTTNYTKRYNAFKYK